MKRLIVISIITMIISCEPRSGQVAEAPPTSTQNGHKIVVTEVLQANSYTYVKASESGEEIWIAIPKRDVSVGEEYYYREAMEMKNFTSKDLQRTFEKIYFLDAIYDNPDLGQKDGGGMPDDEFHTKKEAVQSDINIDSEEGITRITNLYKKKDEFDAREVVVKGMVTKINLDIMNKNWIHIQDGTADGGNFDLTITTLDKVKVGEIVQFKGKVSVDKDFGHGYKYDLILEDAVLVKKEAEYKVN